MNLKRVNLGKFFRSVVVKERSGILGDLRWGEMFYFCLFVLKRGKIIYLYIKLGWFIVEVKIDNVGEGGIN